MDPHPKYTGPVQPSEVHAILLSIGLTPKPDGVWFDLVKVELEQRYRERGLL